MKQRTLVAGILSMIVLLEMGCNQVRSGIAALISPEGPMEIAICRRWYDRGSEHMSPTKFLSDCSLSILNSIEPGSELEDSINLKWLYEQGWRLTEVETFDSFRLGNSPLPGYAEWYFIFERPMR